MQRLSQAARRNKDLGVPLHNPFSRLKNRGLEFYPGDLQIWAAADGTGKSVLAMILSLLTESTTLYVSPDTSASTTVVRVLQHVYKVDGKTAREWYNNDTPEVSALMKQTDRVRYSFRRMVDTSSVMQMCNAYAEVKGEYPQFLIVDGLSSLLSLEESSAALSAARSEMVQQLNMIAATTKACVIVPTHVKGGEHGKNLDNAQRLNKGQVLDNVTKLAAVVLTLFRDPGLGVCIAKNRTDEADATGMDAIMLDTDLRIMSVVG